MKTLSLRQPFTFLLVLGVTAALAATAVAQEPAESADKPFPGEESWYSRPAPQREPEYSLAQQKAMIRGQQRMDRLAMARWNGYSPSRPTHTGATFTTIHNPAWGWTIGRPFSWRVYRPVIVVYTGPTVEYR